MPATILDFDDFRLARKLARKRARNEARLQAERDDAGRALVELGDYCCALMRAAGWREGVDSSADILGPELMAEMRRAASLLLASEAALQRWPGPLPDASR